MNRSHAHPVACRAHLTDLPGAPGPSRPAGCPGYWVEVESATPCLDLSSPLHAQGPSGISVRN